MLFVISRSINRNRRLGASAAIGLALGGMALAVITAVGAGTLLADSSWLLTTVRIGGALYLGYLAADTLRGLRDISTLEVTADTTADSAITAIRQGFFVELLNPKTVLFFLAFLPGFVDTDMGHIGLQMLVLGLLIPLTAIPSDVTVALVAGSMAERLRNRTDLRMALEVVSALILFALAIRVAMSV